MRRLMLGIASRVPFLDGRIVNRGTGGTDRASYCYGVWLKHLSLLVASGHCGELDTVAELGPGDSLGVGLAAILTGASTYRALDVKRFSNPGRNLRILAELIELFRHRAPRPVKGWPDFDDCLDDKLFPSRILDTQRLEACLAPDRLKSIQEALLSGESDDASISIRYVAPWEDAHELSRGSVELILSHSVLEHVRDLDKTHRACAEWLAPKGWLSHQVDLTSHGLARAWNGAWGIKSESYWNLIAGRRDCWINRVPASQHLEALGRAGFRLHMECRQERLDGIGSAHLAPRWSDLMDRDLSCSGLFLQARLENC